MELFGIEIKRKSGDETKAQSFVPPQNDGSVIEIGKDRLFGRDGDTGFGADVGEASYAVIGPQTGLRPQGQ